MHTQRYFRYFDWISFAIVLSMLGMGLLFIFSATYSPERPFSLFFKKQLIGCILGIGIYFGCCLIDHRTLLRYGYFGFFGVLGLLLYTIVSGYIGMGARRWISLGILRVQPSELAKLTLPAFMAFHFFGKRLEKKGIIDPLRPKEFALPLLLLALVFSLILKQPDLGTALLVLFAGLAMLWFVGFNKKVFLAGSFCLLLGSPVLWNVLKPYQQKRILVLLGYGDNKSDGYQIEQSKIAIGSGGARGKGLLQGTQNKLAFLPEDHTDFIFSVICEEWGFIGALLVLGLFLLFCIRILFILMDVPDIMLQTLGLGLMLHILLSMSINIGMVIGLLPIVGIPLPFFSYGLSNLWVNLASVGLLCNIAIRRYYH